MEWWGRDFRGWRHETRADGSSLGADPPLLYASSKRARAVLGQSRSTIDLPQTLHDGGVLLVSIAQGAIGRDVAALVGASLLNLVDTVIREQGSQPFERRRGALLVVYERQSMLSELATQSLAKPDDLSRAGRLLHN